MTDTDSAAQRLEAALAALRTLPGLRVDTSVWVLEQHSHDESHHLPVRPGAVAFCQSTQDIVAVAETCSRFAVAMVPFGTGTGLEGGVTGMPTGVSVDVSGLTRITRVSEEDMDADVEAGVTQVALNRHVRPHGLFFPVDPGAEASLGGMAATGASGTTTVRYGAMRRNVLGLTVVLANGEVIRVGGRSRKSAAGYDLTDLFVGSEGTLGIISELTLRLYGVPETTLAATCCFPDLTSAVGVVTSALLLGVPLSRIELLDEVQVGALNHYRGTELEEAPTLFLEFSGSPAGVAEEVEEMRALVDTQGGSHFMLASTTAEVDALWDLRHDALPAAKALRPGSATWSTDVCVPLSALADCIDETKRDVESFGCLAPIAGHVGDGNFHLAFVLEPANTSEMEAAQEVHDRLVRRALRFGGTCTGEHGVGLGKRAYLEQEFGPAVGTMQRIKAALDPLGLLNPGKVFGASEGGPSTESGSRAVDTSLGNGRCGNDSPAIALRMCRSAMTEALTADLD